MGTPIRNPAVAGSFYNAGPKDLARQVSRYVDAGVEKKDCIGVVSPHAGLMYSGSTAGAVYSSINIPETVLLIGPNHTGIGDKASVMASGEWKIPTGGLYIDDAFASVLLEKTPILTDDNRAHLFEHSLEVQLPFIYFFRNDAKIVPITVMSLDLDECRELGRCIADSIKAIEKKLLIVASSDMSHYLPDNLARKKDEIAIGKILAMDPEGLYDAIKIHGITMCGYVPVTVMLFAARHLGAGRAELVKYATSAEVSGDYDHVVGYAGIVVV